VTTSVHYVLASGGTTIVQAEAGETIMSAAVRAGVPGIDGECGGEMSCATCHVRVSDRSAFLSPSPDEDDLLELADDREDDSRLGCQLKISSSTPSPLEIFVPEG
jgi:2Fe-2S ferredoxin